MYDKNKKLKYEGDFNANKIEGNGKYIYDNGEIYVGHFINNKREGMGKLFNKDRKVKYEGKFLNDEPVMAEINVMITNPQNIKN